MYNLHFISFHTLQQSEEDPMDDLIELVQQVVAFHMKV
jgi:sugar phosphate isomerase/epimerase